MREPSSLDAGPGHFLTRVPLFAVLDVGILDRLAQACRIQQAPKGTVFFLQADPAEAVYVVRSGSVSIVLTSEDGRELVINEMLPGDCFGELALLTGGPRSTGAVARQDSEVIVIPRGAFLAAVEAEPRLLWYLLETTAQRLSSSSGREVALAFSDAPARLARALLELYRLEGENNTVAISQDDLARRAGLTRQTAASILGQWRRLGWLATGRGRIKLLDRAEIERLVV